MLRPSSLIALLVLLVFSACATSPLGRRQLKLVSDQQLAQVGAQAFAQLSAQTPKSRDPVTNQYVRCVANAVTGALDGPAADTRWEVQVFEDPTPNAFALPGGKIGVHTGILEVAENQDQLATVIAHEVAHVIAGHANERMSTEMATQAALTAASVAIDSSSPVQRQGLALLGLGAQVGVILPYSRTHETEADLYGLDLMSKAGFDPRQSVPLWQNMRAAGGQKPPEFLSTHPADATRIQALQARVAQDLPVMEAARAAGRNPECGR
jgi:predicted Zn-dependent protease